jgi:hypothetical protein
VTAAKVSNEQKATDLALTYCADRQCDLRLGRIEDEGGTA